MSSWNISKRIDKKNASSFNNDDKKASQIHQSNKPQQTNGVLPSLRLKQAVATWAIIGIGAQLFSAEASLLRSDGGTFQTHGRLEATTQSSDWIDELPTSVSTHINRDIDPCHDLYEFSCGAWLQQVEIPEDEANVVLAFSSVQDANEVVLKDVMEHGYPLIGELYDSCMNFTNTSDLTANEASLTILGPRLLEIAATRTKEELFHLAGNLSRVGPFLFTTFSVGADDKDATRYALHAFQHGLTLPSPQSYLDSQQFDMIKNDFHAYVETLFQLAGYDAAASRAASVIRFEELLAPLYVPEEMLQDPIATYNLKSVAETIETYPLLFKAYLNGSGSLSDLLAKNINMIVQTPVYFDRAEEFVSSDSVTLDTLQSVVAYRYIARYAPELKHRIRISVSIFCQIKSTKSSEKGHRIPKGFGIPPFNQL
ncbi:hypothetical protein CCR75_003200 [Bremia lactucae]|uniref:Peptidase M13 N-terminal domain-containing protein n=1 Tax=Bremia lactucae TaxID=4779 RepID=A0A976FM45_BRELC|nr:hypothetical protein CCR75_003200 [Bremia lactucae]